MLLKVDPTLLDAIIQGTVTGLEMTGLVPEPVGASRLASSRHNLSVIVGLVGQSSGSLLVNVSELGLLTMTGGMLGEPQTSMTEDAIDAMMEIGNIVAGSVKDRLMGTPFAVREISLPSLVLGQSFTMVYARGMTTVSVEFELPGLPASKLQEKQFSTTISLMRRSGG